MNLLDVPVYAVLLHRPSDKIVEFVAADRHDGASLIVEALDENGDCLSGDMFRCESCELEPVTRGQWETRYPGMTYPI